MLILEEEKREILSAISLLTPAIWCAFKPRVFVARRRQKSCANPLPISFDKIAFLVHETADVLSEAILIVGYEIE